MLILIQSQEDRTEITDNYLFSKIFIVVVAMLATNPNHNSQNVRTLDYNV